MSINEIEDKCKLLRVPSPGDARQAAFESTQGRLGQESTA